MYSFEKLDAWKASKKLVLIVYKILNNFPSFEKYSLCDQIRRSIVSVPSNIAEGSGRTSIKEKIHFIEIAYGSLMEAYCQLILAFELGYITSKHINEIKPTLDITAKLLSGLRTSYKQNTIHSQSPTIKH